jgi:hypothetical protein
MYQHTQTGWLIIGALGGSFAVVIGMLLMGNLSIFSPLIIGIIAFFGLLYLLFYQLTVTVDDEEIVVAFGVGWIKKRIALKDIDHCEIVKNPWWYGWGIRLTPGGWMYNVSGLKAVQLHLKSGRGFRIGTDEPNELAAVIEAKASGFV